MPDRSFLERAVEHADINPLRMALYQATRDPEIAAIPAPRAPGSTSVTLAPEDENIIRRKAVDYLSTLDVADAVTAADLSGSELDELIQMAEGRRLDGAELHMRRRLPAFSDVPHAAAWTNGNRTPEGFEVAIVGAGFSGIAMAVQLAQVGIPYRLYERRAEVGGVWSINTYPDARVDTMNAIYQYGFEKNYPWTEYFARQAEVRTYLEHVAGKHNVLERTHFGHDVKLARFDDTTGRWHLTIETSDGERIEHDVHVVVSASGLFATPRSLDIPGAADFTGQIVHTTAWSDDVDYAGRNVAVIGNGSTGVQLLSRIAQDAARVSVYQRTPQWISPRPRYGEPLTEELVWLFGTMPYYWNWNRYLIGAGQPSIRNLIIPDEEWIANGGKVNQANDTIRVHLTEYIVAQVGGRQELIDQLVPDYPPMVRRPVVDNNWYATLIRDNVELVSTPVQAIRADGIDTTDGTHRKTELIVAAVGFEVEKYLWPTEYYGRGGQSLEDVWSVQGAQAYLGMTVPGFPNMFMLYGPNSQPLAGASALPDWLETWSRYIAQSLIDMIEGGNATVEVRQDTFDEYNRLLHEEGRRLIMLSGDESMKKNYYVNEWGRLQVNAPWSGEQYYAMCEKPNPADFVFSAAGSDAVAPAVSAGA